MSTTTIRPTKKQRELLSFIEKFIGEHGYSPSYREIMNGLNYTSVATVSLHVNNLIRRGHLRKRDRSARSLEVVRGGEDKAVVVQPLGRQDREEHEQWLVGEVERMFAALETAGELSRDALIELEVLVSSLKVLGLEEAALNFAPRLQAITERIDTDG